VKGKANSRMSYEEIAFQRFLSKVKTKEVKMPHIRSSRYFNIGLNHQLGYKISTPQFSLSI
jgi:hypothetical protein